MDESGIRGQVARDRVAAVVKRGQVERAVVWLPRLAVVAAVEGVVALVVWPPAAVVAVGAVAGMFFVLVQASPATDPPGRLNGLALAVACPRRDCPAGVDVPCLVRSGLCHGERVGRYRDVRAAIEAEWADESPVSGQTEEK